MPIKGQCLEIVCQLRPQANRLGLNNVPRISFSLLKSHVKSLRRSKQEVFRCKMAWAGDTHLLGFLDPDPGGEK
jgi:hypothetical protein